MDQEKRGRGRPKKEYKRKLVTLTFKENEYEIFKNKAAALGKRPAAYAKYLISDVLMGDKVSMVFSREQIDFMTIGDFKRLIKENDFKAIGFWQ